MILVVENSSWSPLNIEVFSTSYDDMFDAESHHPMYFPSIEEFQLLVKPSQSTCSPHLIKLCFINNQALLVSHLRFMVIWITKHPSFLSRATLPDVSC